MRNFCEKCEKITNTPKEESKKWTEGLGGWGFDCEICEVHFFCGENHSGIHLCSIQDFEGQPEFSKAEVIGNSFQECKRKWKLMAFL